MKLKPVEFLDSKLVTFKCIVATTSDRQSHNIISGLDFLSATRMELNFSKNTITWDGLTAEMRKPGQSLDPEANQPVCNLHTQPMLLKEVEDQQARILDANHSQADVDAMVDELTIPAKSKESL